MGDMYLRYVSPVRRPVGYGYGHPDYSIKKRRGHVLKGHVPRNPKLTEAWLWPNMGSGAIARPAPTKGDDHAESP